MGLESGCQGAALEVEGQVSGSSIPPAQHRGTQVLCQEDASKGHNRMLPLSQVSGETLQRSEEGLVRTEGHSGPLCPQRGHPLPEIQDADHRPNQDYTTKGQLHLLYRFKRRLLAHSHTGTLSSFPRVPSRPSVVQVQGDALRSKYSPEGIHKTGQGHSREPEAEGDSSHGLSRRLAGLGGLSRGMCQSDANGDSNLAGLRIPHQLGKVPASTCAVLPMAGPSLAVRHGDAGPSRNIPEVDHHSGPEVLLREGFFQKGSRGTAGQTPIRFYSGSCPEDYSEGFQSSPHQLCPQKTQGPQIPDDSQVQKTPATMGQKDSSEEKSLPYSEARDFHHPHGCFDRGLGGSLRQSSSLRGLVSSSEELPYKHLGIDGGLSISEAPETEERGAYPPLHRQYDSSTVPKKGRFQGDGLEPCGSGHQQTRPAEELDALRKPSSGSSKRPSGLPIPIFSTRGGMGTGRPDISTDSTGPPLPGDRYVRDQGEPQTPKVCDPVSRPPSHGKRRTELRLDPDVVRLFVPAYDAPFEGFGEIEDVPREGGTHRPDVAEQRVVSPSAEVDIPPQAAEPAVPLPEGTGEHCLRVLLSDPQPSRVEFLRSLCFLEWAQNVKAYITTDIKESSGRQYQSSWKSFLAYVKMRHPTAINCNFIGEFLVYLFEVKKLMPTTIRSRKSALAIPLRYGFGIEVNAEPFEMMIRSMALQRPSEPEQVLTWDLETVLSALTRRSDHNLQFLLRKTLFLLGIAMGARVSELHALRRGDHFCVITEYSATFSFGSFLAKNENPMKRRPPIVVPAMPSNPALCPVQTLKKYLDRTALAEQGPLFLRPDTTDRLPLLSLRVHIVGLIVALCPGSNPKSHDLRKYAASLAFFGNFKMDEVSRYTGWAGERVFVRHYVKQIRALRSRCVALGKVVGKR